MNTEVDVVAATSFYDGGSDSGDAVELQVKKVDHGWIIVQLSPSEARDLARRLDAAADRVEENTR